MNDATLHDFSFDYFFLDGLWQSRPAILAVLVVPMVIYLVTSTGLGAN